MNAMSMPDPLEESHRRRSDFVRSVVQRPSEFTPTFGAPANPPPKRIVQFWDHPDRLPQDVSECIATWHRAEEEGVDQLLFDSHQAREFIRDRLGARHEAAYGKCYHPAMQSDYFRLCYIFMEGGCYVDADDVYHGHQLASLFSDGRLKLQPLCYDMATHSMVSPSVFTKAGADSLNWIFYFNNNPMIAGSGHPLIGHALTQATNYLEKDPNGSLPEIQSTTGPGNLTESIYNAATADVTMERQLVVLSDWDTVAISKWPLSYRNDARNWRLSNCRAYQHEDLKDA